MKKLQQNGVALVAIVRQQAFMNVQAWKMMLAAPILSTLLYFVVFGEMLGERVGSMGGHDYPVFIAPGLIMMAVFANAFSGAGSSFAMAKATGQINDLLITPTYLTVILVGYVIGGAIKGVMVGIALTIVVFLFVRFPLYAPGLSLLSTLLVAILFSLAGLLNAILCKDQSQAGWVPLFVLSPLAYLGGIFFTTDLLPSPWDVVATYNPMLYMINLFRFSLIGSAEMRAEEALIWVLACIGVLYVVNLVLMKQGYDLRD